MGTKDIDSNQLEWVQYDNETTYGSGRRLWFVVPRRSMSSDKRKANINQQEPNAAGLMLAKLASTQRVGTGLVSKNFDEIKRGAKDMISICDATQWETIPIRFMGTTKPNYDDKQLG